MGFWPSLPPGQVALGRFEVGEYCLGLAVAEVVDGIAESGITYVVHRAGEDRLEAALKFVFTLSAGIQSSEAVMDAILDCAVIAQFEM